MPLLRYRGLRSSWRCLRCGMVWKQRCASGGLSGSGIDVEALVRVVIRDGHGNGAARGERLGSLHGAAQERANEILR